MSTQQYDTVDLVLDETLDCTATRSSTSFIWKCASTFHGDNRHYFIRAV